MSARLSIFLVALALGLPRPGLAQDAPAEKFAPEAHEIERYTQIWQRSPFIVETVAVVQSPGLATKYGLVGLVGSGADSVAFLLDRQESDPLKGRLILSQSKPDKVRNLELVSISMDKDIRKSSVMIKQGTEQATLPFDTTTLSNAGVGAQPGGGMPGAPLAQNMPVSPMPQVPQMPGTIVAPPPGAVPQAPQAVPMPPSGVAPPPLPGQMAPGTVPNATIIPNPNNAGEQVTPPTPTRRIIRPTSINVN